MMITQSQLKAFLPTNKKIDIWLPLVNKILPEFDISTPLRIAAFFAQTAHESQDWTRLEENLNYNATRLMEVWPNRFSRVLSEISANRPERIANIVYSDRLGNGDPTSGDGYRYRGRGIIQLTGFNNYQAAAKSLGVTVPYLVDHLTDPEIALRAACDFWRSRGLNELSDKKMIVRISRVINGGEIGLSERRSRYTTNRGLLKC